MRRWLLGKDDVIHELDPLPDPLTDEVMREHQYSSDWSDDQLQCSPNGQVMLMSGEKSVFDLNAEIARDLRRQRKAVWSMLENNRRRELIRKTIWPAEATVARSRKQHSNHGLAAVATRTVGIIQRDGYRIEKFVLAGNESQLALPGLLFVPETVSKPPVLYLHGVSMKAEAKPGHRCEALVKDGHLVLSAELSGIGETETGHDKRDYGRGRFGPDSQEFYLAYLMGRSFVQMRTTDVFRWSDYLSRYRSKGKPLPIQLIATGEAAIPVLHAAALEPSRFESVRLTDMISSWEKVVAAPESKNQLVNAVHGALRYYDLPDLVELAGKGRVKIEQPADANGR
jgi:hypothetical protein